MARPAAIWSACVILGLAGGATCPAAAQARAIVSQELKQLRAPGKVEAALWTRRSEGYTLQVVLKVDLLGEMATGARIARLESAAAIPKVQVWLLRADGTLIEPRRVSFPQLRDFSRPCER